MKHSIKLITVAIIASFSLNSFAAPSLYTAAPTFSFEVGGSENSRGALATLESGHWNGLSASFSIGLSKGSSLPSVTEGQLYLRRKWEGAYRNSDRQMSKEIRLHYTTSMIGHNTKISAIYGENHGHYKGAKLQTQFGIFTPYISYVDYTGEGGVENELPLGSGTMVIGKSRDAQVVSAGFKTSLANGIFWTIGAEKVVSGDEKSSVVPTATIGWSVELK